MIGLDYIEKRAIYKPYVNNATTLKHINLYVKNI